MKWHIIAVLDHLVILNVRTTTTNKNTHDSPPVLRTMLNRLLKKYGINLAGSIFNADSSGYDDGESNYKSIFYDE